MSSLPPLQDIANCQGSEGSSLSSALDILFEHSPILTLVLQPQLLGLLKSQPLQSYTHLIDLSLEQIKQWDHSAQSKFISGHPRIGESANLSKLSAKEQGAQGIKPTPPEVLARLAHLNAAYEAKYPGLRYITFVNGRSRAAIAEEMEDVLGWEHLLSPDQPSVSSVTPIYTSESDEWKSELNRAVSDVGLIAKSRLRSLGVE
ncbi:Oxo-4-hydroxy-4-carboxy-5-ureidoimidazoline decarboxylase [Coprinopsis sp. MPI-PUGE-AT-0042]|nr:Oxo-4-hydroxy-4-carboxy-5-ureidoimidazoline decarboxylase [Coprinopsis sp. MPI-PUGE-AT-0042]